MLALVLQGRVWVCRSRGDYGPNIQLVSPESIRDPISAGFGEHHAYLFRPSGVAWSLSVLAARTIGTIGRVRDSPEIRPRGVAMFSKVIAPIGSKLTFGRRAAFAISLRRRQCDPPTIAGGHLRETDPGFSMSHAGH